MATDRISMTRTPTVSVGTCCKEAPMIEPKACELVPERNTANATREHRDTGDIPLRQGPGPSRLLFVLATACCGLAVTVGCGREKSTDAIQTTASDLMANVPGQGAREGEPLGRCITGAVTQYTIDTTSVDTNIVGNRDDAAQTVGGEAGLSFRVGIAKGNTRASFSNSSVETETAFSVDVRLEHEAYRRVLDLVRGLQPLVDPSSPRFSAICGDQGVVSSVTYGGRATLNVRFTFKSAEKKGEFHAAMAVAIKGAGKGADFSAALDSLTQQFSSDVTLTVSAFQDGGGSEALGKVFLGLGDASTAADNQIQCSQGALAACIRLVRDVMTYFDSPEVVASFKANPAPIAFEVTPWTEVNLPNPIDVPSDAYLARQHLDLYWDDNLDAIAKLEGNQTFGIEDPDVAHQARLNEAALLVASDICLDKLDVRNPQSVAACVAVASDAGLRALGWKPLSEVKVVTQPTPAKLWGGFYQLGDPGTPSRTIVNPFTGTTSCSSGYTPVAYARNLDPETKTGASLWACVSDYLPGQMAFDVQGLFARTDYDTGLVPCPGGQDVVIARSMQPEQSVGETLHACVVKGPAAAPSRLLGLFTVDGCAGPDTINNALTGTTGCPPGTVAEAILRLKAPESNCGATTYACWFAQ